MTPTLVCQGTRDEFGTREEVPGYTLSDKIEILWLDDGDHDLRRRGRWVNVECRVDIGDEPLFLAITVCCGA